MTKFAKKSGGIRPDESRRVSGGQSHEHGLLRQQSEKRLAMTTSITYRMPAEWEKHAATWLAWPHNRETWPDIPNIENFYADLILELTRGEKVKLLVNNAREEERIKNIFSKKKIDISKVVFFQIETTDAWIRDYGPNFVFSSGKIVVNQWVFNAWGSKYEEHELDNEAGKKIAASHKGKVIKTGTILEGGSIDVNGEGILLTTEECLLNQNRNSLLGREKIEAKLKEHLGATQIVWLGAGIKGDDTDGHVDDIARFVNEDTIVHVIETNQDDENYQILAENKKRLSKVTDRKGKKLNIIELPMPKPVRNKEGERLPASYANFYIGNESVFVPLFNDANDGEVLRMFKDLFPKRSIVGMDSRMLVHGLGGIHCITHEEPS